MTLDCGRLPGSQVVGVPERRRADYLEDIEPQSPVQGGFCVAHAAAIHRQQRPFPVSYTHLTLPTNREV